MKIAIDGPAGAGKSTIAKLLAKRLGYIYIDTGAMYRALTWKAIQNGVSLDDEQALADLASLTPIFFKYEGEQQYTYCNDENITELIRSPLINNNVSQVAFYPAVRDIMVKKQQELASLGAVVMEGRDIGECVLPDAKYKFFITASLEQRTSRRILELIAQGHEVSYEELKDEIAKRDANDTNREVGALKVLDEAIIIDTSEKTIAEVIDTIISFIV